MLNKMEKREEERKQEDRKGRLQRKGEDNAAGSHRSFSDIRFKNQHLLAWTCLSCCFIALEPMQPEEWHAISHLSPGQNMANSGAGRTALQHRGQRLTYAAVKRLLYPHLLLRLPTPLPNTDGKILGGKLHLC